MGPPPFGGGNCRAARPGSWRGRSFNGATAFRRWKQGPGGIVERRRCGSFNGATAFRRWKLAQDYGSFFLSLLASMGPPPFGGGNARRPYQGQAREPRASMGPPPFGGGNSPPFSPMRTPSSPLQWGHRLSAVETWDDALEKATDKLASMGPPPFGGGNFGYSSSAEVWYMLQWGHRLSAVETTPLGPGWATAS